MTRAPLLLLALTACSAARWVGPPPVETPPRPGRVVVVLEPFFEVARGQTVTRTDQTAAPGPLGLFGSPAQEVNRQVVEKHPLAHPVLLAEEHHLVLEELRRLRPEWVVVSPGALPQMEGEVVLVRTVVGDTDVVQTNRPLKTVAAAFSFLLVPLLYSVPPVEETQRVYGALYAYAGDAQGLKARLLRYPTQPDHAVDTRGLAQRAQQPFGLDVAFEEGVLAPPSSRPPALVQGFSRQLAAAVVAVVEGVR